MILAIFVVANQLKSLIVSHCKYKHHLIVYIFNVNTVSDAVIWLKNIIYEIYVFKQSCHLEGVIS